MLRMWRNAVSASSASADHAQNGPCSFCECSTHTDVVPLSSCPVCNVTSHRRCLVDAMVRNRAIVRDAAYQCYIQLPDAFIGDGVTCVLCKLLAQGTDEFDSHWSEVIGEDNPSRPATDRWSDKLLR